MDFYDGCSDGTFEMIENWEVECILCGQRYIIDRNSLHISVSEHGRVKEHYFFADHMKCRECGEELFVRVKVYEYPKGVLLREDHGYLDVDFVKPPRIKVLKDVNWSKRTRMFSLAGAQANKTGMEVFRMPRRAPYSRVSKTNQIRADHVRGMGDVPFIGFQCLNPNCTEFIFTRVDEIDEDFSITCPSCGYVHESGGETKFYDYSMDVDDENGNPVSVGSGSFTIFHDDYIAEAQQYKYCIVCNAMKPLDFFDRHAARASGRQGECRLCKKAYNEIKNGTRLTDQHREAAQKRRLLLDIAGSPRIISREIEARYDSKCFCCGKDLSMVTDKREKPLDHTLPVYYLWPLSTENATLLCRDCNGNKSGTWPSEFYDDAHLRRLSILTGFDYDLLSGPPQYNPEAIAALHDPAKVDALLEKYAAYMIEIIKLRNRILRETGFDFFSVSTTISEAYIRQADSMLR